MVAADEWLPVRDVAEYAASKGLVATPEYWRLRAKAGDVESIQPTERKLRISRASVDRFIERSHTPAAS